MPRRTVNFLSYRVDDDDDVLFGGSRCAALSYLWRALKSFETIEKSTAFTGLFTALRYVVRYVTYANYEYDTSIDEMKSSTRILVLGNVVYTYAYVCVYMFLLEMNFENFLA